MKICVGVGVLLGLLHKSVKYIKGIELVAIQEASPERKNLTVTSLGFILFFLGEGELDAETIKFQLVNISFKNPEVLSCFLWAMLLWFFWRYWLKFGISFLNAAQEIQQHSCNLLTRTYVKFKTNLTYKEENGFHHVKLESFKANRLHITKIKGTEFSQSGSLLAPTRNEYLDLDVSFLLMQLFKLYTLVLMLFKEPSITNLYVPYLLFIFAVSLGLGRIYT
jgi:hypothetical protein